MTKVEISTYADADKIGVQNLILNIQENEFQIDINLEQQPDLSDIPNFYQQNLGNFWVAKSKEKVVGTIALLDIGNREAALRKMFVAKDFRGKEHKVGQQLLDTLIFHARQKGIKAIYLGTTEKFVAAQRFYEKNGFVEISPQDLPPPFPIVSVDVKFYKLEL
ncbi:MAG: hypothetical protein RL757_2512 [Bacteroidota bacterium]|jgi:GNAT superfamily N-acetyltransferase